MYLGRLKVDLEERQIRNIKFRKGLNLIVDETNLRNKQESGNNVGKTTVLRLVDYCLGSNGFSIYQDTEFKSKTNTEVENFLKENNVIITLELVSDFSETPENRIVITRNFLQRNDMLLQVNGNDILKKDYPEILKSLIFESNVKKPSFRQIIARNIRDEKEKLNNTVKVLHPNVTLEQYEAIFLFWFGINTDSSERKQKLSRSKISEQDLLKRLKRERSKPEIEQALGIINRDILELEKNKSMFNLDDSHKNILDELNDLRKEINIISNSVSKLELRREIVLESKKKLQLQLHEIDKNQLKELYDEVESKIENITRDFESLLDFHNSMINERLYFINKELPNIENEIKSLRENLEEYIKRDNSLSKLINKNGAIEELEIVITKLNEKYKIKGGLEEQLELITNSENKLNQIDQELNEINEDLSTLDEKLSERVLTFNKYFSGISEKLYGEQFILVPEKNDRAYTLKITNVLGNLGTGKKKGQIAAFDLAYIQFCNQIDIPCLHFIMHDQLENIHGNQLQVLSEVSNSINAQFIAPILKDKLPKTVDLSKYEVLTLSENNKLFKI